MRDLILQLSKSSIYSTKPTSPDDILLLKQRLSEQEALNRALLEKQADREREIDHLQAQLDKIRRMNFGSRSE